MHILKFVRILYGCSKDLNKNFRILDKSFLKKGKKCEVYALVAYAFWHNFSDSYHCNKLF